MKTFSMIAISGCALFASFLYGFSGLAYAGTGCESLNGSWSCENKISFQLDIQESGGAETLMPNASVAVPLVLDDQSHVLQSQSGMNYTYMGHCERDAFSLSYVVVPLTIVQAYTLTGPNSAHLTSTVTGSGKTSTQATDCTR